MIVQWVLAFLARENQNDHLDAVVETVLKLPDPVVGSHATSHREHGWVVRLVADLVKALFHSGLELIGSLPVPVTMENAPSLHGRLREHLGLDFPFEFSGVLLDLKLVRRSRRSGAHNHVTSVIFVAFQLCRSVQELESPSLLFLLALLVLSESLEQAFAFLDLLLSVRMHNLGEILHESEISSHGVRQTSELTQFWNEGDLDTSLAVLVDQQGLVQVSDVLVILLLVVLRVRDLLLILLESCLR